MIVLGIRPRYNDRIRLKELKLEPNKENIRKWVDALRSGRFIQGFGALEYVDAETGEVVNCCLGVACRLFMDEKPDVDAWSIIESPNSFNYVDHNKAHGEVKRVFRYNLNGRVVSESDTLPIPVSNWLGIDDDDPVINDDPAVANSESRRASHFNDTEGWNYFQIADALEAKYLND